MKKLTSIIILLSVSLCFGQSNPDIKQLIINGKTKIQTAVDKWDLNEMVEARGYFERLLNLKKSEKLIHYYIAYADFRIVGFYFATEQMDEAKDHIDDSINHLNIALKIDNNFAEAHTLLSSMYGNKIGIKPILGMTLGMKSGTHAAKAEKLAPANPRVAFLAGTSAYYTPRMFGGGKEKALKHLEQAATLFRTFKPKSEIDPAWGLIDTYVYLGRVNLDLQNYKAAETNLKKCLELRPDHGWAKELLTKCAQDQKQK